MTENHDPAVEALHQRLTAAALESAPLAWDAAEELCHRDREGHRPCVAYHRLWQYLALLGIVRSIRADTRFLIDAFRRAAREEGARRILISGAADYGMLAHVVEAFELEALEPQITVVDRCATPLMLNRWYAARCGLTVETRQADVLCYQPDAPADVVCSHSFLGWFTPTDKRRLAMAWHDMLVPGGIVVTTRRLYPGNDEWSPKRFDEEEAKQYQERVRAAAEAFDGPLPASPAELAQAGRDYTASSRRYPTPSRESLAETFAAGGFPELDIDDGTAPDADANRPSGPLRGSGNRLRIVARRPA